MSSSEIIAGLDVGTCKIAVIIAEVTGNNEPKVVGVGVYPSEGLRRGVVIDFERTIHSIVKAVEEAELMAGVEIDAVYAGIAGDHIKSFNSRGLVAVSGPDYEITPKDVRRVIDAAKAISIPFDRRVIHVLPQEFIVDDQGGIKYPVGISGIRLQAEVHIVTAAQTFAQNICRCISEAGLKVNSLVLEPLASSYAVLEDDERELGVGLIDMGGGTTDIALFLEGSIRHTAVIGYGGNYVTNDIAKVLRTPISQAERIKIKHGCALRSKVTENDIIEVPGVGGRNSREVSKSFIANIIQARMEEILTMGLQEITRSGYSNFLTTGIVLTGGGSLLDGTVELAEEIFDLPVKLGVPQGFGGLVGLAQTPIHATGVGLIFYALKHKSDFNGVLVNGRSGRWKRLWKRVKQWSREFF